MQLIPRLKGWVNTYYPGTKIGLTEYNWGAEGDINGATTQADLFGIFGREGLDLATRWTTPANTTPTYAAMKMFRNYDGHKSGFGDLSVSDTVPNPDLVSSFASVRSSDGALTVVVINKQVGVAAPFSLTLANFAAGSAAQAWQMTSANAITRLADVPVAGGAVTLTVPAQSITLLVFPPAPTGPSPVTLAPAADTYVVSGSSAIYSHGLQTVLDVKNATATSVVNWVTYLKFDLTGVTATPKTATLSLTLSAFSSAKTRTAPCSCKVYGVPASGWTEAGLTWNTALASEALNANVTGSGTLAASTPVGPGLGVYTWDVSSYLKGKAGQVVTLQVIDETADNVLLQPSTAEKPQPASLR